MLYGTTTYLLLNSLGDSNMLVISVLFLLFATSVLIGAFHDFSNFIMVNSMHCHLCLQMSEVLNQKSSVQGKVPSGYLNAIFDLSGSWLNDASDAKYLAFDGYFVSLYYLHLTASPLLLQDQVKKDVPPHWDPASLSR